MAAQVGHDGVADIVAEGDELAAFYCDYIAATTHW